MKKEHFQRTIYVLTELIGLRTVLKNQNTAQRKILRNHFSEPESLTYRGLVIPSTNKLTAQIDDWVKSESVPLSEMVLIKAVEKDLFKMCVDDILKIRQENKLGEFVYEILDHPLSEMLLFTLSDTNLLSLKDVVQLLPHVEDGKSLYVKQDLGAILFIMFHSDEFALEDREQEDVTKNFNYYISVLDALVEPILLPFTKSKDNQLYLLNEIFQYTLYGNQFILLSELHAKGPLKKRLIVFEHLLGFTTRLQRSKKYKLSDVGMFDKLNWFKMYDREVEMDGLWYQMIYSHNQTLVERFKEYEDA